MKLLRRLRASQKVSQAIVAAGFARTHEPCPNCGRGPVYDQICPDCGKRHWLCIRCQNGEAGERLYQELVKRDLVGPGRPFREKQ